jgi:hypothetical protein
MLDPRTEPDMPTATEVSFTTEIDSPNDIPTMVEISFCYFMMGRTAIISKSEIDFMPDYIKFEHILEAVDNYMKDTVVEFIR